jgi:acyl dehydratase
MSSGTRTTERAPRTRTLSPGPISREALTLFAEASGDHNPIHLDADVARSAGWDDVIAHGMLSMAYLGRLLTDGVSQQALRSFRVRFIAITPVYAEPTFVAQTVSRRQDQLTLGLNATLADGTAMLTGTAVIDVR